jgi:hypothetical protein
MLGKIGPARNRLPETAVLVLLAVACGKTKDDVPLSRSHELQVPDVPIPAADGPRLGAIAHTTPVREAPVRDAKILGYLHAGSTVARADQPLTSDGCEGGWYPVRPRGFVCLAEGATLDLRHPTLATMAIQPNLDAAMPYTYARAKTNTAVFEVDADKPRAVRSAGELTSKSGAAVVGSWEAEDEQGGTQQLAMLTDGRFLDSTDLDRAKPSEFQGVAIGADYQLPMAYVVKRGISLWDITGPTLKRKRKLEYHEALSLTGRYRTSHGSKFWESADDAWIREQDVTMVRQRTKLPEFVNDSRRWADVSIIAGTMVAYEGATPVYATLVSVGKDRLGDELPTPRITERGEFAIVSKHITALNAKPGGFANRVEMHDVPWVLELASGQLVHGSYWHNRFGIEHGPGNLQLAPADARWLWSWATPAVPPGWHAVLNLPTDDTATIVNIRK